ncbi:MAG: PKD domain-containing protein, partial [Nanoarchaeota archaeon]|nr:PKD domain-containing protein [Nanoarchaeota archaeon]
MKNKTTLGIFVCLLLMLTISVSASISSVQPEDDSWFSNNNLNFSFSLTNYTNTTCSLIVDGVVEQSSSASASDNFVETIPEGEHTWNINCTNNIASEERTLYVDLNVPTIQLGSPLDESEHEELDSLTFTVIDNLAENVECNVNVNGNKQTVTVQNSTEENFSITSITGTNYWNITCSDEAENTIFSSTRTFEIEEEETYPFTVILEKSSYNIGQSVLMQITAVNDSNVTVEICPNEQGFVLCYNVLRYNSNNYPEIEVLPYTDKVGNYILEGRMQYGNISKTYTTNFSIRNNIQIDVDGDTSIAEGETTEIKIAVSGGITPYTYNWILDGGGTSAKKDQNFTYDKPDEYTNILKVTDAAGNTRNATVNINVKELYKLVITVKDSSTNKVVSNANLEISGTEKKTNSQGVVTYYLTKGNYKIYVSHTDFEFYVEDDYRLKENTTLTLELSKADNTKPSITVISPVDGDEISNKNLSIIFRVSDESNKVTCDLYTAEQ